MKITSDRSRRDRCAAAHPPRGRRAFTLTELLVVIAIVGILMAVALVSLGKALGTGKRAATDALLASIGTALEQYQADIGEYPPLVSGLDDYGDEGPNAIDTPEVQAQVAELAGGNRRDALRDAYRRSRYNSEWTIGAFLMGIGDINGDGDTIAAWWEDENSDGQADADDNVYDDGKLGYGFRNPGKVGAWKKFDLEDGAIEHDPARTGNVYGPYLEAAERFIERVPVEYDSSLERIVVNRNVPIDAGTQVMYRLVDSWGNPIRYYRNWRFKNNDREVDPDSMGYAPIELRAFDDIEVLDEFGDKRIDGALTRAPYALLSAGADPLLRMPVITDGGVGDVISPFGDVLPEDIDSETLTYSYVQSYSGSPLDFETLPVERRRHILELLKSNLRYTP